MCIPTLKNLLRSGKESSDSEAEDFEHAEKLRHVKAVLEEVNCCFHLRLVVWFYMILHSCEAHKVSFCTSCSLENLVFRLIVQFD